MSDPAQHVPDHAARKRQAEDLAANLARMTPESYQPHIKELVETCLFSRDIDHQKLSALWLTLFAADPDYAPFYNMGALAEYPDFPDIFEAAGGVEKISTPFFLLALQSFAVADPRFERLMTYLRRYLLEDVIMGGEHSRSDLAIALALYCYRTQYVFAVTPEERAAYAAVNGGAVAIVQSCYTPFTELPQADLIAERWRGKKEYRVFLAALYDAVKAREAAEKGTS